MSKSKGKYDEDRRVYSSKGATVEVTVKVKKRRDHDEVVKADKKPFPKGSWGDLLCQNRVDEIQEVVKQDAKDKLKAYNKKKHQEIKCCLSDVGDYASSPSPLCHKIPISKDLYLETHTHIRSKSSSSPHHHKENKEKLNLKPPSSAHQLRYTYKQSSSAHQNRNDERDEKRHKNASTSPPPEFRTKLVEEIPEKKPETPAKKVSKTAATSMSTSVLQALNPEVEEYEYKVKKVEEEKEALRSQAEKLIGEITKAKREQQQSVVTITELYTLAERFKQENLQLMGAQKQQDFLEEKLIQAVQENQELKQYLQNLMKKQNESSNVHDDQLSKIRSVIEEVKSSIQEEIQVITTTNSQSSLYNPEHARGFDFNVTETDSVLLNDTNASEIQAIFGSQAEELSQRMKEKEKRLADIKSFLAVSQSPGDIIQKRLAEERGRDAGVQTKSSGKTLSSGSLAKDISRTFKPIQLELSSVSSSSSSYRSTNSTPTNT